jgi:hypothetical protein
MYTSVTFLLKEELNGRSIDSSTPTGLISHLLDRGIPCNHISLLITSPPLINLGTRFLLRGRIVTPHVTISLITFIKVLIKVSNISMGCKIGPHQFDQKSQKPVENRFKFEVQN